MQYSIVDYIKHVQPVGNKGKVITRQGILWRINNALPLPNVVKVDKIGKQFVLTVRH